jgi:MFS family permease
VNESTSGDTPAEAAGRRAGISLALLATVLGNAAAAVTYSALPLALTELVAELTVGSAEEIWMPDSFLLAVMCVTPLTYWLIGVLGVRRLLQITLAGLVVSTAVTALSSSLPLLIGLLFLQGLFAAPIPPATQVLVAIEVPRSRRGLAMSWWSGGTMLGVLAGAAAGGWLTEQLGWRWIFALAVPFGIAAWLAAVSALCRRDPSITDDLHLVDVRRALHDGKFPQPEAATDWRGLALMMTCLLSAGVAIDMLAEFDPRWIPAIAVLAAVTLLSGIAFALHYRRIDDPILDLSTLRAPGLATAAMMNFVVAGASTGIFETLMLASVLGFAPETLSTISLARGAALLVGIALGGFVVSRGARGAGALVGLVVLCAGKAGYTLWSPQASTFMVLWPGIISSVGFGMLTTIMAVMAISGVERRHNAAAASVFVFSGVVGSALGVAALDALRAWRDAGGAATGPVAVASYTTVFWIELLVTLLLIPLLLADWRGKGNGGAT